MALPKDDDALLAFAGLCDPPPAEEGLFRRGCWLRRVSGEPVLLFGGGRALLLEIAHPRWPPAWRASGITIRRSAHALGRWRVVFRDRAAMRRRASARLSVCEPPRVARRTYARERPRGDPTMPGLGRWSTPAPESVNASWSLTPARGRTTPTTAAWVLGVPTRWSRRLGHSAPGSTGCSRAALASPAARDRGRVRLRLPSPTRDAAPDHHRAAAALRRTLSWRGDVSAARLEALSASVRGLRRPAAAAP
jgi:hypothetical protein